VRAGYNGEPRWRQPLSLKALRGELPLEIERHQPELLSVLIDQGNFLAELPQPEAATLSTLLFRMDQAETEGALAEATRAMAALSQQAANTLSAGCPSSRWARSSCPS